MDPTVVMQIYSGLVAAGYSPGDAILWMTYAGIFAYLGAVTLAEFVP